MGHSWGSILGVLMAKAKPDLFQAFVGTGQVGDPRTQINVAFDAMLAKARALGDARALRELEEIGPSSPYKDRGYPVQRRWSNLLEGADAFIHSMLGFALSRTRVHDARCERLVRWAEPERRTRSRRNRLPSRRPRSQADSRYRSS